MTKGLLDCASKFALLGGTAVALALSASAPASAASMVDRGLEKRVSDLEAEVRLLKNRVKALEDRKLAVPDKIVVSGNSRVKVTLYGQVNRAVRFYFAKNDGTVDHVDNDASSSRIGILARGRLFPDVTISALTEVEWQENRRSATGDHNDGNERVRARHVDLWFTHAELGSLYLGHGSTAADAASLFSLSGTSIVWASHGADDGIRLNTTGSTAPAQTTAANAIFPGMYYAPTTGLRQNRIMYVSPRIAGFSVRVSHGERDQFEAGVRYAGSPFGLQDIRVLGAFGYIYAPNGGSSIPGSNAGTSNTYALSGGILHVPTGLNINGAWATTVHQGTNFAGQMNQSFWYVEGGWQGRIWAMGKSYFSVGGGTWNGGLTLTPNNDIHAWRINTAFVQSIDAAATDIYAGYAWYDGKRQGTGLDAGHMIIIGARIKF
ncbi:MAG: hypothetical protein KDA63_03175 [Planctomycetales bacterium]|nr:hypothetical protein [Planctomycetales bacterium]